MARNPVPLALVPCDAAHVDLGTGRFTIVGTLSVLHAPAAPAAHSGFAVYLCLTGCRGRVRLTLRLVDVDEERPPVFAREVVLDQTDPLAVAEAAARLRDLVFPAAGEYRLQLLGPDGSSLIERRLTVVTVPPLG